MTRKLIHFVGVCKEKVNMPDIRQLPAMPAHPYFDVICEKKRGLFVRYLPFKIKKKGKL